MPPKPQNLIISAPVQAALSNDKPVVALESTVLTHGLPYPDSLKILRELERLIESAGAVPATIIVWQGEARVGLDEELVEALEPALRKGGAFRKLGRRDLPLAMASGYSGGTTVSGTMLLAWQAGIEVFATGGIGGVHQGWGETLDISSDLSALAQIPVTVVSAGCKAILDIAATLEYLETLAVPVLGWQVDRFPLFYTRDSDYRIDPIDSLEQFAAFHRHHSDLGGGGILVANPIPAADSIPALHLTSDIQAGIVTAKVQGIGGKELTPFLLDFLAQHTKGESVRANLALLKNNALLAAKLAGALKGRTEA